MGTFDILHEYASELEKRIRLQTCGHSRRDGGTSKCAIPYEYDQERNRGCF